MKSIILRVVHMLLTHKLYIQPLATRDGKGGGGSTDLKLRYLK